MQENQILTIIGKEYPDLVIPMIQRARKSIDIIVYDWRWYPDQIGAKIQRFNNAIINAAQKNIKVRTISTSWKTLRVLEKFRVKVKKANTKRLLHTKLMIIDNEVAILGSHNYTMNAFTINLEISVIIMNKEVIDRLKQYFTNLWEL